MQAEPTVTQARAVTRSRVAWGDLQLVLAGAALLVGLVLIGERVAFLAPLRLILGLAYVLFVPGYCLAAALFPHAEDLDGIERVGISLGLSVALVPLLALLLDRLPWGLRLTPILVAQLYLIAIFCVAALWRRGVLAPGEAFSPPQPRPRGWWRGLHAAERRIYALAGGALAIAGLVTAWVLLVPAPDSYMTEFYALGREGRAEDFPRQAGVGETLEVTVGIANHERAAYSYRVELWVQDTWQLERRQQVAELEPFTLAPGEAGRWPVAWSMPWAGQDQQVELLLFRDVETQPYRRLLLWLDVRQ